MNVSKLAVYVLRNTASIAVSHDDQEAHQRHEADSRGHAIFEEHKRALASPTSPLQNRSPQEPASTLATLARRGTSTPAPDQSVNAAAAEWARIASYTSAAPAQATGLTFLANRGDPQKSGTFD
jgi:hypothetical protein